MSEVLTVRNLPSGVRPSGDRPAGGARRRALLLALPAMLLLAACGGGWSSSETYTGDIRPTVPRPAGAGPGATAEPEVPPGPAIAGEEAPDAS